MLNIAAMGLAILLHILDVPVSNLNQETGSPQSLQESSAVTPEIGLLPHSLQFY
jgi:hypothetical protein